MNIWTHLIAAIGFLLVGSGMFLDSAVGKGAMLDGIPLGDRVIIALSFAGAIFSFLTSTAYHTAMCHSPELNRYLNFCTSDILYTDVCSCPNKCVNIYHF